MPRRAIGGRPQGAWAAGYSHGKARTRYAAQAHVAHYLAA
jgi:hypothetical protein